MRCFRTVFAPFLFALFLLLPALAIPAAQADPNMPAEYAAVLEALGRNGDYRDKVLRINVPRNDLKLVVEGVETPTPFGFGGWLAMTAARGGEQVMMGDLVLLEDEVNAVMSVVLDNGLEVTALHNHFFYEQPRMFYMHVGGHGPAADLARRVKPALELIGKTARRTPEAAPWPVALRPGSLNTEEIARLAGHSGDQTGPVYKITVGRPDLKVRHMDAVIGTRMGLNSWAAFVGNDGDAAIAGDIAMKENELNGVLKALRANDIEIVAIHNHMVGVEPPVVFLHYWGRGPAAKLAAGFRAALDRTATSRAK